MQITSILRKRHRTSPWVKLNCKRDSNTNVDKTWQESFVLSSSLILLVIYIYLCYMYSLASPCYNYMLAFMRLSAAISLGALAHWSPLYGRVFKLLNASSYAMTGRYRLSDFHSSTTSLCSFRLALLSSSPVTGLRVSWFLAAHRVWVWYSPRLS